MIYKSAAELIGKTPMLELTNFEKKEKSVRVTCNYERKKWGSVFYLNEKISVLYDKSSACNYF